MWMPGLLSLATFVSTLLGGFFALSFQKKSHLILGFMAGFLLGIVGFEIFPEIVVQVNQYHFSVTEIMGAMVASFLVFHVIERLIVIHHAHEHEYARHKHPQLGIASALALAAHSFMDGISIGLAFHISLGVGLVVAMAVISHDFTDGMNTVAVMLSHQNTTKKTVAFLVIDAVAPIAGYFATLVFHFSPHFLALYLGSLAGFLLYIGASDILPEAHSECSSGSTIVMTVAGSALAFGLSRLL